MAAGAAYAGALRDALGAEVAQEETVVAASQAAAPERAMKEVGAAEAAAKGVVGTEEAAMEAAAWAAAAAWAGAEKVHGWYVARSQSW